MVRRVYLGSLFRGDEFDHPITSDAIDPAHGPGPAHAVGGGNGAAASPEGNGAHGRLGAGGQSGVQRPPAGR